MIDKSTCLYLAHTKLSEVEEDVLETVVYAKRHFSDRPLYLLISMCELKHNIPMVTDPGLKNLAYDIIVLESAQNLYGSFK